MYPVFSNFVSRIKEKGVKNHLTHKNEKDFP